MLSGARWKEVGVGSRVCREAAKDHSLGFRAHAGCDSQLAQYSNTPSLRVAGFEDEDDDSLPDEACGL